MKTEIKLLAILACLTLLAILAFFLWKRPSPSSAEDHAPVAHAQKKARNARMAAANEKSTTPKASAITDYLVDNPTSGTVRVKPGETLTSGYFEIEPGSVGMWLVTPEKGPDGKVRLKARIASFTDADIEKITAQGFLPASLAAKNGYAAVSPADVHAFIYALQDIGADLSREIPIDVEPGKPTTSVGMLVPGSERITLHIIPLPVSESDGVDLDLDFKREHTTER